VTWHFAVGFFTCWNKMTRRYIDYSHYSESFDMGKISFYRRKLKRHFAVLCRRNIKVSWKCVK